MVKKTKGEILLSETEKGFLIINARTASGALPVPLAVISIYKEGSLIAIEETNQSGITSAVAIDAPRRELSLTPSAGVPYSLVSIKSEREGYYSVDFENVPIYPGITSIQPINMIPISSEDDYRGQTIYYDEGKGPNL